jgi:carbamate kinase
MPAPAAPSTKPGAKISSYFQKKTTSSNNQTGATPALTNLKNTSKALREVSESSLKTRITHGSWRHQVVGVDPLESAKKAKYDPINRPLKPTTLDFDDDEDVLGLNINEEQISKKQNQKNNQQVSNNNDEEVGRLFSERLNDSL